MSFEEGLLDQAEADFLAVIELEAADARTWDLLAAVSLLRRDYPEAQ
jgi:hypothetical protein